MQSGRIMLAAIGVALALAACNNDRSGVNVDGSTAGPSPAGSTAPEPSSAAPAASIDPAAQPAVDAYRAFNRALAVAEQQPFGQNEAPPDGGDISPMSVDPFEIKTLTFIWSLKANALHYGGTAPVSTVGVASVDLKAAGFPAVILTDCQTQDGWELYQGTSPTPLPDATDKVPPPHPAKITVIKYKGAWSIRDLTVDASTTCAA